MWMNGRFVTWNQHFFKQFSTFCKGNVFLKENLWRMQKRRWSYYVILGCNLWHENYINLWSAEFLSRTLRPVVAQFFRWFTILKWKEGKEFSPKCSAAYAYERTKVYSLNTHYPWRPTVKPQSMGRLSSLESSLCRCTVPWRATVCEVPVSSISCNVLL